MSLDIEHIACEESQQDWSRLEYKDIYRKAFIDGAKYVKSALDNQWVCIKERKPEVNQECLILMKVGNNIERGIYIGDGDFKANWCSRKGDNQTYRVIYWMPCPELPSK